MAEALNNLRELFEMVVSKHKDNNALAYADGRKITYSALQDISEKIALKFVLLGLSKGDVVLISGDKSPLMFAALVAALKNGIIYSVYDPDIPDARLEKVLQVCEPALLIGSINEHFQIANKCGAEAISFLDLEGELQFFQPATARLPSDPPCDRDIAYIVFTSGSTGTPKGATMSHSNVRSLIAWSLKEFRFCPGEILTNLNPCYFDNFVFDFYSSIFSGATLVPFTKDELRNPAQLVSAIENLGCTSWFSVPSLLIFLNAMKAFSKADFPKLRRIIFGGEGYPKSKLLSLYNTYRRHVAFFNVYGPSECTCIASNYEVSNDDFANLDGFLPIGALVQNFDYLIVNEQLEVVPEGEKGQLCLIGPGVGMGYFNQPDLTRNCFIPKDRIVGQSGDQSVYLTGDLVSFNPRDHKLYIHGRKDHQIKHMGYRIELEDIENALMLLPYVTQACCTHHYHNGISRVTAFLAVRTKCAVIQIKDDLSKLLPTYMMPTHFTFLQDIPKNQNGKIDRVGLTSSAELLS